MIRPWFSPASMPKPAIVAPPLTLAFSIPTSRIRPPLLKTLNRPALLVAPVMVKRVMVRPLPSNTDV